MGAIPRPPGREDSDTPCCTASLNGGRKQASAALMYSPKGARYSVPSPRIESRD